MLVSGEKLPAKVTMKALCWLPRNEVTTLGGALGLSFIAFIFF